MPPRYAYWTILIDGKATAFRASEREELMPTFNQLARKNTDIVMRYFARGRLWDNPEQAQWANRNLSGPPAEKRNRDWRPGGEHKDPRARFTKKPADRRDRPFPPKGERPVSPRPLPPKGDQRSDPRPRFTKGSDRRDRPLPSTDRKPHVGERPLPGSRSSRVDSRQSRGEERKPSDARPQRPGGWNRPPKRKPR